MSEPNLDRWAREVVKQPRVGMGLGLVLTLMLHFVGQLVIIFIVGSSVSGEEGIYWTFISLMYIGLSQLVYMIPAILIARHKGHKETAKGLMIGGSLTFLLNAACNGLLFLNR